MSHKNARPNKFVESFINQMDGKGRLKILDVGCHIGTNTIQMARLGHHVMGVSIDDEDIEIARKQARRNGLSNCSFETMDARDLKSKFDSGFFNAVLVSDMLHEMDKADSIATIDAVKTLTAPKGLNAIRGYLVDPHNSISERNIERMFQPDELRVTYDADPNWRVLDSTEDVFTPIVHNGRERVSSHADVIAQKRI